MQRQKTSCVQWHKNKPTQKVWNIFLFRLQGYLKWCDGQRKCNHPPEGNSMCNPFTGCIPWCGYGLFNYPNLLSIPCVHRSWTGMEYKGATSYHNICIVIIYLCFLSNFMSNRYHWRLNLVWFKENDTDAYHDDVIKRKHFPLYWPFVRGIHRWIPHTKASDGELWCVSLSVPE